MALPANVREGGFFLEERLGGVGTSAVRSAPCDGSWQAVLVVTVAVAQRGGGHFCAGGVFFLEECLGGVVLGSTTRSARAVGLGERGWSTRHDHDRHHDATVFFETCDLSDIANRSARTMQHPVVCCRQCGTAVLPLAEASVTPQGSEMLHLTAAVPSLDSQLVRLEDHHKPGMAFLGTAQERLRCLNFFKVCCQVCSSNLGDVQSILTKDGGIARKQWFLETRGVGFRLCSSSSLSRVRALSKMETFATFARRVGVERVIETMPKHLPEEQCNRDDTDEAVALEGVAEAGSDDGVDAVPEPLENAHATNNQADDASDDNAPDEEDDVEWNRKHGELRMMQAEDDYGAAVEMTYDGW